MYETYYFLHFAESKPDIVHQGQWEVKDRFFILIHQEMEAEKCYVIYSHAESSQLTLENQ